MHTRVAIMPSAHTAIEQLYQAHYRALLTHLTRLVGDHMAAEDLCQETFTKALRGWGTQPQIINQAAWLYRIATNTAYDHLRRRRRIHFAPLYEGDEAPECAESMEARLDAQEPVQRALAQLPPEARRLLVLTSYLGHSTHELATALACSDAAVRLRLFRARERFRKAYLQGA
jgi:RNA polymerase sigma-70 factor (ECF subfamily)